VLERRYRVLPQLGAFAIGSRIYSNRRLQQTASLAPTRRDVAYFDAQAARIEPLLDKLSFIRSREHWGMAFRRGLVEVSESDMEVIAKAMSATAYLS